MTYPIEIVSVHLCETVLEDRVNLANFKARIGPFTIRRGTICEYLDGSLGVKTGGRQDGGISLRLDSPDYAALKEAALSAYFEKKGPR